MKLVWFVSTLTLFLIAGCASSADTVAVRTGIINDNVDIDDLCYEGWRCEEGERYYLTTDCDKEDISICRKGCSPTIAGECIPTEDVERTEFLRSDDAGRVMDIQRVRADGPYTRMSLRFSESRQVYFSEDEWYIVKLSGLRDKEAFFSVDGQSLAPLRKGGITHHNGLFIRVIDFEGVAVSVDVGKTP